MTRSVLVPSTHLTPSLHADNGYENSSRVYGDEGWDMQPPLRSAVMVYGPINDPSTPSLGWSVEVALPLKELMYNNTDEVGLGLIWVGLV